MERDLLLIFLGWGLGFGGQLIFELFRNKREKKRDRIKVVLDFNLALIKLQAHQVLTYKIDALKNSYLRRMEIASNGPNQEWYNDVKALYMQTDQRQLDHLSKDQEILVLMNKAIYDCLAVLTSDHKFISWAVRRDISLENKISPDFSNCPDDDAVQQRLIKFQEEEIQAEIKNMQDNTREMVDYLSNRYIGKLIDVSNTEWYLRWFEWLRLRYFD